MNKEINRWAVLWGSVGVLLCTGSIYAFSVFAKPLSEAHDWTLGQIMMAFTINAAISPIPTILGGIVADRGYAKISILVGGLLFGFGFLLTGFATTPSMLYLCYGILAGFGQGIAYSGCLSNTMRLFPDKKGLASGLITAGMGGATIIAAPVANYLIENYGVLSAFKFMGTAYVIITIVCSLFIKVAPANYVPKGWTPPASGSKASVNVPWTGMIRTFRFYVILSMLAIGAFSGLMIASNAAVIGQSMFGVTATAAAFYVSIYSLCNCLGRALWGFVSDKIGRSNTLMIIYAVIAIAMFALTSLESIAGFVVGIVGLGLCFGGIMGVFPSIVMENYGPAHQGVNYGITFIGYSTAAFFAPRIAANIAEANDGDFTKAFYIAIGLAITGLAINFVYKTLEKNSYKTKRN
ncbi:OFA family MFS transporter [Symbiobacterium thermophilum]|uniref:MFS transporter n=1 Tax=Symbiobacterium thermophilum TaxID=2734 RepID=A0A953IB00_SYMTR|nr:OFA family MFS transporter [Symbiobacterium thermophilum]MBY6276039.1 MFS transporter [Symbiobacterium thermophilum]